MDRLRLAIDGRVGQLVRAERLGGIGRVGRQRREGRRDRGQGVVVERVVESRRSERRNDDFRSFGETASGAGIPENVAAFD